MMVMEMGMEPRCRNCWRPYAMHTEGQDKHGGWHMWCPDCQDEYEPDESPEARVHAAADEWIELCRRRGYAPESEVSEVERRFVAALLAIEKAANE